MSEVPSTPSTRSLDRSHGNRRLNNAISLSYLDLNIGNDGSVLGRDQIREMRLRQGYCTECPGEPVRLYRVHRNRFNPLWVSREPLTVDNQCLNGQCLVCHQELRGTQSTRSRRGSLNVSASTFDSDDFDEAVEEAFLSSPQPIPVQVEADTVSGFSPIRGARTARPRRLFGMHDEEDAAPATSPFQSIQEEFQGTLPVVSSDGLDSRDELEHTTETCHSSSQRIVSPIPPSPSLTGESSDLSRPSIDDEGQKDYDLIVCELEMSIDDMPLSENQESIVNILVDAMHTYTYSETIQVYCLGKIWNLCKSDEVFKVCFASTNVPEVVLVAMKDHLYSPLVQQRGCGAIWALATIQENRIEHVPSGAPARIMDAIIEYGDNVDVVRAAIGALRTILTKEQERSAPVMFDAAQRVSEVMDIHRMEATIQRDGCACLSNLATDTDERRASVVTRKELDVVVHAIGAHIDEPSVVAAASLALKNYTSDERNLRILRQCRDLISLLHSALETGGYNQDASDVLERLEVTQAEDESLEEHVHRSLTDFAGNAAKGSGAVRHVVDFMNEYAWSAKVVAGGLECLSYLAGQGSLHRSRMTSSVLKDVINSMEHHGSDMTVQINGCRLLECLAEEDERCFARIVGAKGCLAVVKAIQLHLHDENVMIAAFSALRVLSSNFECWLELEETGSTAVVKQAVQAYSGSQTIFQFAGGVLSNFSAHAATLSYY